MCLNCIFSSYEVMEETVMASSLIRWLTRHMDVFIIIAIYASYLLKIFVRYLHKMKDCITFTTDRQLYGKEIYRAPHTDI